MPAGSRPWPRSRSGTCSPRAQVPSACPTRRRSRATRTSSSRAISTASSDPGRRPRRDTSERSPIHHTDGFDRPLILFQGLDDPIVPPAQSEAIADALRAKGVPVAYLAFEGEQHGFRRAENIVRVAEAELWFYGQVLGFEPADTIEPVPIDNADALPQHRSNGSRGSFG